MTTAEAAATFDARSFTPPKTKEFDDASTRGRLEHAVRAAVSGGRAGLGVADRRAGAATLRLRFGSVCGRAASRDRRGRRRRRVGARTGRGERVVRRVRSCRRPRAHDPHRRRLLRDAAAARLDRRATRRRRGGGRACRRGRRKLRRGHARAARAPGRAAHCRGRGVCRPARVPAGATEGGGPRACSSTGRIAASRAAAARGARPARRGGPAPAQPSQPPPAVAAPQPTPAAVAPAQIDPRAPTWREEPTVAVDEPVGDPQGLEVMASARPRTTAGPIVRAAAGRLLLRPDAADRRPAASAARPALQGRRKTGAKPPARAANGPEASVPAAGAPGFVRMLPNAKRVESGESTATGPRLRARHVVARIARADRCCPGRDRGIAEAGSYHGHG